MTKQSWLGHKSVTEQSEYCALSIHSIAERRLAVTGGSEMVGYRRTLMAVALGMTMISLPAKAQQASSGLTNTVTVTVPPRVKVQVAALSATPTLLSVGSTKEPTQGVALTVNATRTWILSIGSTRTSSTTNSNIRWSLGSAAAFSRLSSDAVIASGSLSNQSAAAGVYFRNGPKQSDSSIDGEKGQVVFTMSAP
jgi:hypothetical protein